MKFPEKRKSSKRLKGVESLAPPPIKKSLERMQSNPNISTALSPSAKKNRVLKKHGTITVEEMHYPLPNNNNNSTNTPPIPNLRSLNSIVNRSIERMLGKEKERGEATIVIPRTVARCNYKIKSMKDLFAGDPNSPALAQTNTSLIQSTPITNLQTEAPRDRTPTRDRAPTLEYKEDGGISVVGEVPKEQLDSPSYSRTSTPTQVVKVHPKPNPNIHISQYEDKEELVTSRTENLGTLNSVREHLVTTLTDQGFEVASSVSSYDQQKEEFNSSLEDNGENEVRTFQTKRIRDSIRLNKCIILPDDPLKPQWDSFIILLLMYTATVVPYRIAFYDRDSLGWLIADYIIDCFFAIDIVFNFLCAYFDYDENLVHDRKEIAKNYLKSWFLIDLIAIIPFNLIFRTQRDYSSLARLARLPRLYRLFKITKLFRMLKIVRERSSLLRQITDVLKISANLDRLFSFGTIFLIMCHVTACMWYLVAKLDGFHPDTWVLRYGFQDSSNYQLYVAGLYWTITTITTVGFGDIRAGTTTERWFASILMVVGVISYSFAIGSLTSILASIDSKQAKLKEKLDILNSIRREFNLPMELYMRLRQALKYDHRRNAMDRFEFLNELPNTLKLELSYMMHEEIIDSFPFFKDKSKQFVAYIGPLLRPQRVFKDEYVFMEGDTVEEIYFLIKGTVELVLPKLEDAPYLHISSGYYLGELDFIKYMRGNDISLKRQFTAKAKEDCEMLCLSRKDLLLVMDEFYEDMNSIFTKGEKRLTKTMIEKLRVERILNTGENIIGIPIISKNTVTLSKNEPIQIKDIKSLKTMSMEDIAEEEIKDESLEEISKSIEISEHNNNTQEDFISSQSELEEENLAPSIRSVAAHSSPMDPATQSRHHPPILPVSPLFPERRKTVKERTANFHEKWTEKFGGGSVKNSRRSSLRTQAIGGLTQRLDKFEKAVKTMENMMLNQHRRLRSQTITSTNSEYCPSPGFLSPSSTFITPKHTKNIQTRDTGFLKNNMSDSNIIKRRSFLMETVKKEEGDNGRRISCPIVKRNPIKVSSPQTKFTELRVPKSKFSAPNAIDEVDAGGTEDEEELSNRSSFAIIEQPSNETDNVLESFADPEQ